MGTALFAKYPEGHTFAGLRVLNVGCGAAQYKSPNVVNLDAYDVCKPDVVHNLEKTPLPFEDESFDLILCNHILEHLNNWWECFNECARILKWGGIIEVYLPGAGSDSQLGYRDHVTYINRFSFFGVHGLRRPSTNAWAMGNMNDQVQHLVLWRSGDIMLNKWWIRYAPSWLKRWMSEYLRNVNYEQMFIFRKMKPKGDKKWVKLKI